MDAVIDIVRMQLLANQNQLVKDGKIAWKTLLILYVFSNHKAVTNSIQSYVNSMLHKMAFYKKYLCFEKKPKSVVYLKMDATNDILKEMLARHAFDFGSVRMKSQDVYHAKSTRTINIHTDVYLELYYAQPAEKRDNKKDISDLVAFNIGSDKKEEKDGNKISLAEDVETYENTRAKVYSYTQNVQELVQFLQDTYTPSIRPGEVANAQSTKLPNLCNLTVVRMTEIDKNSVIKGEKQDFVVSKNFHNIFLEREMHEKLHNHIHRFQDKSWYAMRGIPRTLGILLHGIPGCGKTSFIKSLCAQYKRTAVIVDFKLIKTAAHLRAIFTGTIQLKNGTLFAFDKSKLLYVFEDFDCMSDVFLDREMKEALNQKRKLLEEKAIDNILKTCSSKRKTAMTKKKRSRTAFGETDDVRSSESENELSDSTASDGATTAQWRLQKDAQKERTYGKMRKKFEKDEEVTLNDLLEIMDGIIEMDGRMIVMTTNCKHKIDKALLRPGRIDLDLQLCPPSLPLICEIFFYMYQDHEKQRLMELWNAHQPRLHGSKTPTAMIMNCFMYMDPAIGLEMLCRENSGIVTDRSKLPFGTQMNDDGDDDDDDDDVEDNQRVAECDVDVDVEDAYIRARKRIQNCVVHGKVDLVDTSGRIINVFESIAWDDSEKIVCEYIMYGPGKWDMKKLMNPTGGTYPLQNQWNQQNEPQVIVFRLIGFKVDLTELTMVFRDHVPCIWEFYGSSDGEDWMMLANADTAQRNIRMPIKPTVYFTSMKLVILKTVDWYNSREPCEWVNVDLTLFQLLGYVKKT